MTTVAGIDYLPLREVCNLLGFAETTVRRLAHKHHIALYKLAGDTRTYIKAADVERLREPVVRVDRFAYEADE